MITEVDFPSYMKRWAVRPALEAYNVDAARFAA